MFEEDIPKYKKKSTAKGQPRSKHKHEYITVLLRIPFEHPDIKTGRMLTNYSYGPTKVCSICGRIDEAVLDPIYFNKEEHKGKLFNYFTKNLSGAALALPKYEVFDFMDKFAVPMEEEKSIDKP